MWRYAELLPLDGPPTVGLQTGMTPLVRADRLAERARPRELWVKNDAVCHPTLSFKDRVVVGRDLEGDRARHRHRRLRVDRQPGQRDRGPGRRRGPARRRPHPVRSRAGQGARHQHLRRARGRRRRAPTTTSTACARRSPASTAGASSTSTCARSTPRARRATATRSPSSSAGGTPAHVVVPMAGGSLVTKIGKAFGEFEQAGPGRRPPARKTRIHGAQAAGLRADRRHGAREPRPGEAGQEADHHRQVAGHRQPGRRLLRAPDDHRLGRLRRPSRTTTRSSRRCALLAETEGIFTETAGGVTLGAAHPADRERADRQGRRPGRHLRHRQRHEDAGPAGRRAARSRR